MFDASNRKDIRRAEKAARLADRARVDYLLSAMSTPPGRAWFYTLLDRCHAYHSSFTPDPYQTAFREGERNIGLQVLADIQTHCPDHYILMIKEANYARGIAESDRDPDSPGRGEHARGSDTAGGDTGRSGDYDPYASDGDEE